MTTQAKLVEFIYDHVDTPGSFQYIIREDGSGEDGMIIVCPCGCRNIFSVAFEEGNKAFRQTHKWNKNREKPTLSPSLEYLSWSGSLIDGQFIS